ncbi:beta-phosphoglucomutase [Psychrobacillus sp. INOP01]|uniref:beta-phosphoglucomutase n=1 Tax=Psychrobacillus sp. INOP01 TaxID=2829187 RepID=UPI001BA9F289|nr:beta-phosphoglucomutase [Psychrobacillus sp. INOP01]QUG41993.1 beta-phosphoglucomutase [Psychrobacillus sp. INOP01]
MTQYPKAFIYDLDGVITDTAEFHYLAWKKLAEELGISFDRQFNERLKGISRMESLELILQLNPSLLKMSNEEKVRLASKKNEFYLELAESINEENVLPGIEDLLKNNKEQNIKIALGSASENAKNVVEKLGLISYFDYIVDASKVSKGKPDPETFTTAADYLGIPYEECIGIEDAAAGIEAINKANMFSVGVGSLEHLSQADYLVEDTSKLDFKEIMNKYSEKNS